LKAKSNFGSSTLDPPGSADPGRLQKYSVYTPGRSGALHHNALDNDAEGDIFPQRDQQLSRQGDYGRLLQTTAIAQDAFFKPQRQRRLRLVAKP
jgi:hypothetical protein